jgi:hypothetical protein
MFEAKIKEPTNLETALKNILEIHEHDFEPGERDLKNILVQTVSLALEPLWQSDWNHEQFVKFLKELALKLKFTLFSQITTPNPILAGPLFQALRHTIHEPAIKELYLNLLATAMNKTVAHEAHPAFVEMIRQMTPDEVALAKYLCAGSKFCPTITVRLLKDGVGTLVVLRNFSLIGLAAECTHPELAPAYLDNLARLNLIEVHSNKEYADPGVYKSLENHPQIIDLTQNINLNQQQQALLERGLARVTSLGLLFYKSCF